MKRWILAVLLLVAAPMWADYRQTIVLFGPIADRPTCDPFIDGVHYDAYDANASGTCTSPGTGSSFLGCACKGSTSTWTATGGGGGGGTPSALLDGGTMHTDTTNSAATRGDIIIANSTPAWDDLAIGSNGKVLKSNGTDPAWNFVDYSELTGTSPSNALLDGSKHTDTTNSGVTRGDLVFGNSTPAWDDLPIGAAGTVLRSDGTDFAWWQQGKTTYKLYNTTTNATQTELFTDGASAQITMPNSTVWMMDCLISARRTDTTGGYATYRLEKGFVKNTTAGSIAGVAVQVKTVYGESDAAWDVTMPADTSSGNPSLKVTGEAAKTIGWTASCEVVESPP